ncbi:hypothetical protein [Pseudonocardia sp. T1-2H]|uniref:hypothetical protein n=1 Tax=Pseudonocardia sp. T1-2H TaxID=3128899 RepID=UPI0031014B3B
MVLIVGAGSGSGASLRLGHFAAMRWSSPDQPKAADTNGAAAGERFPEVFVGGEGLARGPAEVLATLLHEAAHALAHVRRIKDTSRQGRWHNARFKALAEELEIEVTKDAKLGWSPTSLPVATRATYAVTIGELGQALRLIRAVEITGAGKTSKPSPPAVCGCGRKIRVSKAVLVAGPILCGACGTEFTVDGPDPEPDIAYGGDGEGAAGEVEAGAVA